MVRIASDTPIRGIDCTLLAVEALLASNGYARLARLAELAQVAVTRLAKPLRDLLRFFPAGWIAAMSLLWWLDQWARSAIFVLMVVAYLA
jgi:hypothetical protein